MKLYVAYCHDRHVDPVIEVFSDRQRAIDFARAFMQENMAHPEHIEEEEVEGHEVYLSYAVESDHAFVVAVELDKPK